MHLHPSMLHARTNGYQSHLRATLPGLDFAYPSIHPIPSMPALTAVPCRCPVGTGTSACSGLDPRGCSPFGLVPFGSTCALARQGRARAKSKARPRQRPPSSTVQYSRTGTFLPLTGAHHSHKKLIHLLASPRLPQPQTTTREQEQRVQAPKYD